MTVADYRQSPGLNYSKGKLLLRSGLHFLHEEAKEETLALRLGTAVDEYILSGRVKPCAIMPPEIENATGKGSRTARSDWRAIQEAAGLTVYKMEEYATQMAMQRALEQSVEFQDLLAICPERQVPVFAKYRGVELKALLDLAGRDFGQCRCFGDLKTSRDASRRGFARLAANNDYDLQMVWYSTVLGVAEQLETEPAIFWAVVESTKAAPVSIFAVPENALISGKRKLDTIIDRYLDGQENGFSGYGKGWQSLEWPRWAESDLPAEEAA